MLKILRTKTRKVMLTTLILVIPSFVFYFGWQSISGRQGGAAIYIAFGRATGWMQPRGSGGPPSGGRGQGRPPASGREPSGGSGTYQLQDVHGAGAQRSDPKSGDPALFPHGRGPQGDVIRIYNHVRLVRSAI